MNKDMKKLIKKLADQGFTVTATRNGHYLVRDASGAAITSIAGTASDHRSIKNSLSPLKRAGFRP